MRNYRDDDFLAHCATVAAAGVQIYTVDPLDAANSLRSQAVLLLVAHQYESPKAMRSASADQLGNSTPIVGDTKDRNGLKAAL